MVYSYNFAFDYVYYVIKQQRRKELIRPEPCNGSGSDYMDSHVIITKSLQPCVQVRSRLVGALHSAVVRSEGPSLLMNQIEARQCQDSKIAHWYGIFRC